MELQTGSERVVEGVGGRLTLRRVEGRRKEGKMIEGGRGVLGRRVTVNQAVTTPTAGPQSCVSC